jgi:hypothetical protein
MRPRTIVALVVVALIAVLGLAQYLTPVRVVSGPSQVVATRTTGLLKELREPSWFSSPSLKRATVMLADGSTVEASVVPGCDVRPGQSVHVDVFGANITSEKSYVVLGAI